jgi:hypothetical protein
MVVKERSTGISGLAAIKSCKWVMVFASAVTQGTPLAIQLPKNISAKLSPIIA